MQRARNGRSKLAPLYVTSIPYWSSAAGRSSMFSPAMNVRVRVPSYSPTTVTMSELVRPVVSISRKAARS